jgi:transcriptional regulator with GAF, ATPase, and Fis domain
MTVQNRTTRRPQHPVRVRANTEIERRTWHNWALIVSVSVISTLGLGSAFLSFVGLPIGEAEAWSGTDVVLLGGLSILVVMFAVYLTLQQRRLMALRSELEETREKTSVQIRKHYERLLAVYTVSQTMASETDPQAVFDRMARVCYDTFSCEQVSLMLLDSTRTALEVRSAFGHADGLEIVGRRQALGIGIAGWVAETHEALLLGPDIDPAQFRDFRLKEGRPSWSMVVPILLRDELVGVLNVSSRSPQISYDQEDLQALLVFAENAGICIRHTEQTEWMRQTNRKLEATLAEYESGKRRIA